MLKEDLKTVMISGCLLGIQCRYDGKAKEMPELVKLLADYRMIPFCPESLGGLTIPRLPAEIRDGDGVAVLDGSAKVITQDGQDYTLEFIRGAKASLQMAKETKPEFIVLKANSPSCGVGLIYDGLFSRNLKTGDGVTTAILRSAGETVYTELDVLQSGFGKKCSAKFS